MESNSELKQRLDNIFFQIVQLRPDMREDMRRLWRPSRNIWNELDKELVECRRIRKVTSKYTDLELDLLTRIEVMEKYITFATLLG